MALDPDFGPNDHLFPPLPEIDADNIRLQVFTHRSYFGRPTHVFEDHPNDLSPDNERLEHLGDTVLQLVVTSLMLENYLGLRVGPATKIRALIVGNATLAKISSRYRLPDRLRSHPAQSVTLRASIAVQADLFEAFVGGLYLDKGLDSVKSWLYVLLRPYAAAAYREVRIQHGLPPDPPAFALLVPAESPTPVAGDISPPLNGNGTPQTSGLSTPSSQGGASDTPPQLPFTTTGTTSGHLALFNQYLHSKQIEWTYSNQDPNLPEAADQAQVSSASILTGGRQAEIDRRELLRSRKSTPVWFARILVNGEHFGTGKGGTKKAARNEAAKEGLAKMGIVV